MGSALAPGLLELLREYRSIAGGVLFFTAVPVGVAVLIYADSKRREAEDGR